MPLSDLHLWFWFRRRRSHPGWLLVVLATLSGSLRRVPSVAAAFLVFNRDIKPILSDNC